MTWQERWAHLLPEERAVLEAAYEQRAAKSDIRKDRTEASTKDRRRTP